MLHQVWHSKLPDKGLHCLASACLTPSESSPEPIQFVSTLCLVTLWQEISSNSSGAQGRSLERIMLPVSGLASWVVVCGGSLMCLSILGINVQPLLTVGGVSTVLVGLSAQSVLANLISGINLVSLGKPCVPGKTCTTMLRHSLYHLRLQTITAHRLVTLKRSTSQASSGNNLLIIHTHALLQLS